MCATFPVCDVTTREARQMAKPLTFEQKREMVWEDYASGRISEVRADEMLREIVRQEREYAEESFRMAQGVES